MMFGFGLEGARRMKKRIKQRMGLLGKAKDVVITTVHSEAETCEDGDNPAPYLMVRSDNFKEVIEIVTDLKGAQIGVDVEMEVIRDFVQAKDMR